VPDAGHLFFIDVHAVDARSAWLLGTDFDGYESRIYRTGDGGDTWSVQYADSAPGMFLDGLAFWDASRGIAFGDPVDGAFVVLVTEDSGTTWSKVDRGALPAPLPGEAGFAASGTAVVAQGDRHAWFGTGGGAVARVYRTEDGGSSWTVVGTSLPAGSSAGIFGVAFRDTLHGVAVGGDYRDPMGDAPNLLRTVDGGHSWAVVRAPGLVGVQYGVVHAGGTAYVAAGPPGTAISRDDGATWTRIDSTAYNTVTAAGTSGTTWAAGRDGRVARLVGTTQ
jgi:photosystem II stability/assembly factor-like uncharacterized protein